MRFEQVSSQRCGYVVVEVGKVQCIQSNVDFVRASSALCRVPLELLQPRENSLTLAAQNPCI